MSPFFGSNRSMILYKSRLTSYPTPITSYRQPSAFERLPLELRNKIYAYLGYIILPKAHQPIPVLHGPPQNETFLRFWYKLDDNSNERTMKGYRDVQEMSDDETTTCPNPEPALLLACKKITNDLYSSIYSKSMFEFHYDLSAALTR